MFASVKEKRELGSATPSTPAYRQANRWGWRNPPPSILAIAEDSLRVKEMRSGEALIQLGLVEKSIIDDLVEKQRTEGIQQKFLDFAATKIPTLRSKIDRILTLKGDAPYYESLNALRPHPVMNIPAVYAKCESLDAVIMEIEETTPVVVFSQFQALQKYKREGRFEKQNDPIRAELCGNNVAPDLDATHGDGVLGLVSREPHLAVGARSEIAGILSELSSKLRASYETVQETMWHASSATEQFEKDLARLLDSAIELNATDIDLDPQRTGGCINFMRRFGDLVAMPQKEFDEGSYRKIMNFLMQKSGANPYNTRIVVPGDGRLTYRSSAADVFLRLNFIPLGHPGSQTDLISASIRILPRTDSTIRFGDLKVHKIVQEELTLASREEYGFILVCGGTNTGKSTLLGGVLGENYEYYGDAKKRIMIEQPIERFYRGVKQINVSELKQDGKQIDGFEMMLRACKRHDPDVISVGEIRDQFTADASVAAAVSGHLVLSTIHANHTVIGFDTLAKKIHPDNRYQLIESLSIIVGQRLLKKLCQECAEDVAPTEDEKALFELKSRKQAASSAVLPNRVKRRPKICQCDECGNSGYTGLIPVNEVLPVTYDVKEQMIKMVNGDSDAVRKLYEARKLSMFDSAVALAAEGIVELKDALA